MNAERKVMRSLLVHRFAFRVPRSSSILSLLFRAENSDFAGWKLNGTGISESETVGAEQESFKREAIGVEPDAGGCAREIDFTNDCAQRVLVFYGRRCCGDNEMFGTDGERAVFVDWPQCTALDANSERVFAVNRFEFSERVV